MGGVDIIACSCDRVHDVAMSDHVAKLQGMLVKCSRFAPRAALTNCLPAAGNPAKLYSYHCTEYTLVRTYDRNGQHELVHEEVETRSLPRSTKIPVASR